MITQSPFLAIPCLGGVLVHGSFKEKICSCTCCIFFGLLITLSFFVAEETDFRLRHPEESIPGTYEGALCGHGYEPYDSFRECAPGIVPGICSHRAADFDVLRVQFDLRAVW